MTPEEFEDKMQYLVDFYIERHYDPERFHANADEMICNVMRELGYDAGIDIFEKTPKWYA